MAGVLKNTTKEQLKEALAQCVAATTLHIPAVEAAQQAAAAAIRQYQADQVPDVKGGTNSGGAVGQVPGTQGSGKGGGPGVQQIAPQDGAGPRSRKRAPHNVRKARYELEQLRISGRS
jgi:hypothetical protein